MLICSCCTVALANGDTSGCEFHCPDEHHERLCQFGLEPGEIAVVGKDLNVQTFRCVGCGDDQVNYAHRLEILTD